jgi:hypothetical protein|nr:MAG TPA: hypothetical protein [Crassvirales sp.]
MRKKDKLYTIKQPINLYPDEGNTKESTLLSDLTNGNGLSLKNTFSGQNLTDIAKGGIGALGSVVGQVGGNLIGGGLSSGAGNAIGSIGSTVGSAISSVNPLLGGIVSVGSGLIGGLTNRMFGSKLNQENINQVKGNISSTANTSFGGSVDDLMNQLSGASMLGNINRSDIGKDGWFSHKAKNLTNKLRAQAEAANTRLYNNFNQAADVTNENQFLQSMYNVEAFGGPLFKEGGIMIKKENRGKFTESANRANMGVQEYARHILANKEDYSPTLIKRANFARNFGGRKAFGGDLNTYGGTYNGGLEYIDNGGTHEQNPFNGVPMGTDRNGTPNLVEEGETIWNDYVFSNRLKVPETLTDKYKLSKDITFAEASKKLGKEIEETPNDPISKRTFNSFMQDLQQSQEEVKAKKELAKAKRQFNKLSPQEQLGILNGTPVQGDNTMLSNPNEMASNEPQQFNDGGWMFDNMWEGEPIYKDSYLKGNIPYYQGKVSSKGYSVKDIEGTDNYKNFTKYALTLPDSHNYWQTLSNKTGKDVTYLKNNYERLRNDGKLGWVHRTPKFNNISTQADTPFTIYQPLDALGNQKPFNMLSPYGMGYSANDIVPFSDRIDANGNTVIDLKNKEFIPIDTKKKTNNKEDNGLLPTWMRYAPIVGSAIGAASSLLSKPDESSADAILTAAREAGQYTPISFNPIGDYITYNPFDRDYYINKLNAESGAARRAIINQASGNRGNAMAGILAADYNAQNQLGALARQAEEYNLAQKQKVAEFNRGTNMFNTEGMFKADTANQAAKMQARSTLLQGTMQAERLRQAARQQLAAERSANLTNLFNNIGNIGRENMNFNILNTSAAFPWAMTNKGESKYKSRKRGNNG